MFVSKKSLTIFTGLNSFLICLALLQSSLIQNSIYSTYIYKFLNIFFIFIFRNYLLLYFVNSLSSKKENISHDMSIVPTENYIYEFHINIISSTTIETISHIMINTNYVFNVNNYYYNLVYFIPVSFLFELIFDLFHYIGHRTLHNHYLYKYIHKKHHKFQHPTTMVTFYQDPIDIIITNTFPIMLTLYIVPKMSYFQFSLINIYKTYGEICGHVGKKCYPASSFCQFIWLPKLLNIELYTEEHDLHHCLNNCNYSKRFSLWDKMFGTFKPTC